MSRRIKIEAIRRQSLLRPPDYLQHVMASGTIDGEFLVIGEPRYIELLGKYRDYQRVKPPSDLTRTDAPSFLTKVKNFAVASAKHVAAGMPMASDEEIIRRHDICLGCEFLKDNACTKCGCPVVRNKQYISKLSWADSACPVGKWGPEATGK